MENLTARVSVTMEVEIEGCGVKRKGFFTELPFNYDNINDIDTMTDDLCQIFYYCARFPAIYESAFELVCTMLDTPPDQETDEPVGEPMGE